MDGIPHPQRTRFGLGDCPPAISRREQKTAYAEKMLLESTQDKNARGAVSHPKYKL